jgi:pyruvate dehydrogenase E1 component
VLEQITEDVYHLHGLDANAIMRAARTLLPGRGARFLAPLTS